MIRHASIYDPAVRDDGLRVLVMRRWPRGVRKERIDLWLKDAAPSLALLDAYNHAGLGWEEFQRRYRAEILNDRPQVVHELRRLAAEHGQLTLLCHERIPPASHCHREVLLGLLNEQPSNDQTTEVQPPHLESAPSPQATARGSAAKPRLHEVS